MMYRKLRGIGTVFIACVVVGAFGAANAQAVEFHSSEAHTILSGGQVGAFKFVAGSGFGGVTCSTVDFTGTTATKTAAEWKLEPTFSNCKDSFGRTVHWFLLCPEIWIGSLAGGPVVQGAAALFCIGSAVWALYTTSGESTVCTVEINSQTGLKPISLTNEKGAIRMQFEISNLKNTTSGGFFNCGIANGEHTAGTLVGTTVISGKNTSGSAVTLSVE